MGTAHWEITRVGDALHLINGRAFKPSEWTDAGLPIIRIQNLNKPTASYNRYAGTLPEKFVVNRGDLLFAWSGTPGTSFGAHVWRNGKAYLNQHIFKVVFSDAVFSMGFLQQAINQNLNSYIQQAHGGAGLAHITKGRFEASVLPLPPLVEQRAIVAKIEALFSELDKGVEQLESLQKQLKRYRQSVLKAAFEGKLTESFRLRQGYGGQGRAAQSDLPTVDDLLAQIKTEREARYQQSLADWQQATADWEAIGGKASDQKKPRKPAKPKELPPLTADELAELPELPEGWGWTSLIEACDQVVDCHNKTPPYEERGVYLVRTPNVRDGKINLSEKIKFVSEASAAYWSRRCVPQSGDILFTREAPMGEACIIPPDTRICMGQRMMLFRVFEGLLSNRYLLLSILDHQSISRALRNSIGSGVQHLRVGQVEEFLFPLAPLPEQHQIVAEIESRFSVLDQLEKTVEDGLKQAEALRQSILKKAFEGRLLSEAELAAVRADPEYEPAEKLLERIKAEREFEQPSSPAASPRRRKATKITKGKRSRKYAKGGRSDDEAIL